MSNDDPMGGSLGLAGYFKKDYPDESDRKTARIEQQELAEKMVDNLLKKSKKSDSYSDYNAFELTPTLAEICWMRNVTKLPDYQRNGGVEEPSGWKVKDAHSFHSSNTPVTTLIQEHTTVLLHNRSVLSALRKSSKADAEKDVIRLEKEIEEGWIFSNVDGRNGSDSTALLGAGHLPFPTADQYSKKTMVENCKRPDLMGKKITDLDDDEQLAILHMQWKGNRYLILLGDVTYEEASTICHHLNERSNWRDQEKLECLHSTSDFRNYIIEKGLEIKDFCEYFTDLNKTKFGQKTVNQTMAKAFMRISSDYAVDHNPKDIEAFYLNNTKP